MSTLDSPGGNCLLPAPVEGRVFEEPWQATAFALALQLSKAGYFSRDEWTTAFSAQLAAAAARGEPDDGTHYYQHWLVTLEGLVTKKGLLAPEALTACKEAWTEAFRTTAHGQPVKLPGKTE